MNYKKLKNNNGTALFLSLMILSSVLIASLGAANLVVSSIEQGRTQINSTKAYYAAEAGAERVLWEIRKNGFDFTSCSVDDYIIFDNINTPPPLASAICGPEESNPPLSSGATYSVQFISGGSATTTTSVGKFKDSKRTIEISF